MPNELTPGDQLHYGYGAGQGLLLRYYHDIPPILGNGFADWLRSFIHLHRGVVPPDCQRGSAPETRGRLMESLQFVLRFCRRCGCTDDHSCTSVCAWVDQDLCSNCLPFVCQVCKGDREDERHRPDTRRTGHHPYASGDTPTFLNVDPVDHRTARMATLPDGARSRDS